MVGPCPYKAQTEVRFLCDAPSQGLKCYDSITASKAAGRGLTPWRPAKLFYDAMSERLGGSLQNFLGWFNSIWHLQTI